MACKFIRMALFIALVSIVSGCDFLRFVASRPTSADLEVLAAELREKHEAEQAASDSVAAVLAFEKKCAEARSFLEESGIRFVDAAGLAFFRNVTVQHRFCLILGSFSDASNADRLVRGVKDAGVDAVVISRGSATQKVVAAGSCDDYDSLLNSLAVLRERHLCPEDVWILVNER